MFPVWSSWFKNPGIKLLESKTCLSAIMSAVSLLIDTMNCKIYLFIHSYIKSANEYHQLAWPPVKSRTHCEGQKYIQQRSKSAVAVFKWCGNLKPVSLWPSRRQKHRPDWLGLCSICDVCVQPALCLAVDFYPVLGFQRVDSGSR